MQAIRVLPSFLAGLRLCMRDVTVRRLALRPWLIAACSYVIFGAIAFYYHDAAVALLSPEGTGFWRVMLQSLAWFFVTAILLVMTTGLSIIMALILSGVFQTDIASYVLRSEGLEVEATGDSIADYSRAMARSVVTEGAKLLWIAPLAIILLIMGFIPLFTIPAAIGGAWLLAYGSFDFVLEAWGVGARGRLGFAVRNGLTLVAFGFVMMACCLIPFVGLLLPPVGVAGAAHFCAFHRQILPKKAK